MKIMTGEEVDKWMELNKPIKSEDDEKFLKDLNEMYPTFIHFATGDWDFTKSPELWDFLFDDYKKNRNFFKKHKAWIHKKWVSQFDCDFIPEDFPYFDMPVKPQIKRGFLAYIYGRGNIPRSERVLNWIIGNFFIILMDEYY